MTGILVGSPLGRRKDDVLGVNELRSNALRPLGAWAMACGVVALASLYDPERIVSWGPSIALVVAGFAIFRLARVSPSASSVLLVVSLWGIVTSCILMYPGLPFAPLYSLIVLPAAILLAPWVAALVGLGGVAAVVAIEQTYPGTEPLAVYGLALFMIASMTILAWLLAEPLKTALGWAWSAYEQAQERVSEARQRQGELGIVSKSLNETLTQLEALNRQLAEARAVALKAQHLKSEFAAAVSHELRTPLNLIVGFAELLVLPHRPHSAPLLPDTCRKQLQAIYRNACHISNLIDDILDLSQIDAHRLALHKEIIRLEEVIEEAVAVVRDLFEDEGLYLKVDLPVDLPLVRADSTRVRQIVINLLSNASRFTDEGGVTIRARCENHQVVVAVADTGVGIPSRDLPYVFDEFRQFGERKHGGSGLGLSICKRLIELHGGNMWVESTMCEGSTFSFSLPMIEAVAVATESLALQRNLAVMARQKTQPTLAVVDREGLSKVVERYLDNYRIERVESVEKARRLIASGRASGVVFCNASDVGAWRAMQLDEPSLHPVAFCPLRTTTNVPRELGVADCLVKPVTLDQLGAALRRARRRARVFGIVEDHPEMGELLTEMIQKLRPSCRIWTAANGRDALTRLREDCPDCLLLDLLMPRLNGYELLHEIRRDDRLRKASVIVITGAEDHDERIMAEMVGITRQGGMTVGEAMACLKRGLDSLLIRMEDIGPE